MSRTGIVLAFAMLLAVFELGSTQGLRCYQCNSANDRSCGEPFSTSGRSPVDCESQAANVFNNNYLSTIFRLNNLVPGSQKTCAKIVLRNGQIARTCLDHNPTLSESQACNLIGATAEVKSCSLCQKDSCNGAGAISASVPVAFIALVASYLYYKQ